VLPGKLVTVTQRAQVICQEGKSGDRPRTFLNVLHEKDIEGWIPEFESEPAGNRMLVDYTFEPAKNVWISIVTKAKDLLFLWPTPGFCGANHAKGKLASGDIFPVEELCHIGDTTFFRVPEGGWVCDKTDKNQKLCDVVEREDHWWQYTCIDKDGTAIRAAPTRAQNMNIGKNLKHRQRVCTSEIVKFSDGDTFLHIDPPNDGWVPMTKLGGQKKCSHCMLCPPEQGLAEAVRLHLVAFLHTVAHMLDHLAE